MKFSALDFYELLTKCMNEEIIDMKQHNMIGEKILTMIYESDWNAN